MFALEKLFGQATTQNRQGWEVLIFKQRCLPVLDVVGEVGGKQMAWNGAVEGS
jgi:hypothetical protein